MAERNPIVDCKTRNAACLIRAVALLRAFLHMQVERNLSTIEAVVSHLHWFRRGKRSNVQKAIEAYNMYRDHAFFDIPFALYTCFVQMDQAAIQWEQNKKGSLTLLIASVHRAIDHLKSVISFRQQREREGKQYVLDQLDLSAKQKSIIQFLFENRRSDSAHAWCVGYLVRYTLERVDAERSQGKFDSMFLMLHKIRCKMVQRCTLKKRVEYVQDAMSIDKIQRVLSQPDCDTLHELLCLIQNASMFVLETPIELSSPSSFTQKVEYLINIHTELQISVW